MTKNEPALPIGSDEDQGFPTAGDGFFERPVGNPATWSSAWERDHDWYHYAAGYRDAAEVLLAHVKTEGRGARMLGPPIVFLYRQHLELSLKRLAHECLTMLDRTERPKEELLGHRLDKLWDKCVSLVDELSRGMAGRDEVQQTARVLKEFCVVDTESTVFRYPENKRGDPSLSGIGEVDLDIVCELASKVSNLLECIDYHLSTI